MNVLQVDSSILDTFSVSRTLTSAIVARLRKSKPDLQVTYRDVAADPPPYFSGALAAHAAQPDQPSSVVVQRDAAKLGEILAEVLAADVIVIGAPMYNFGIPSQLKAWLDALAVPGKTFRYASGGAEGLLGDKRLIIASSQGGLYTPGSPAAAFEHQESHLQSFFRFLGIEKIEIIRADGVKIGGEGEQRIQAALQQAAELQVAS